MFGTGVSELNPALSEELARLRRQNEQLVAKVGCAASFVVRALFFLPLRLICF